MNSPSIVERPLALVGLRCSGKSTIAHLLAGRFDWPFCDLDAEVVRFARFSGYEAATAGELIENAGWARFRDLEANALKKLIEPMPRIVLATGGGVVERADNRSWLQRATRAFWLDVPIELLQLRLAADGTHRPALTGGIGGGDALAELPRIGRQREAYYRAVGQRIECFDRAPDAIAEEIAALCVG